MRLHVEEKDVAAVPLDAGEDDGAPVGRPRGRERHVRGDVDALEEPAAARREDEELAAALLPAEDGDAVAVRREGEVAPALGARREVLADDVLVLRRVAGREVLVELAVPDGEERDVDVALVRRERRDEIAGRGRRRPDLEGLAAVGTHAEALSVLAGLALDGEEREVLPPQVPPELEVEVVGLDLERAPERHGDVAAEEGAVLEDEVPDGVLAPLGFHEVVHGMAVTVGGIALDVDLRDRRDEVLVDRVPQVHAVLVVLVVAEVRRHPLDDPGRNVRRERAAEPAAEEDLVLEDVRELVLDERLELLVRQVDGKDHPVAGGLGEGADALGDEVELDVVLLELGVRRVIDDRDTLRDLVVQPARQLVVGRLGHRDDLLERLALARVVVHVEVRRLVDRPVELVVDDLVLPGGSRRGREERARARGRRRRR